MRPATPEAYKLFHEGVQTLARVEHNGIKIDLDYLTKAEKGLDQKIKDIGAHLYDSEVYEIWRKLYGKKTNIDSADQLGRVLFDELKIPYVGERTATGKYSTDDEVLRTIDLPWVKKYLQRKKYYKARHTFLANIRNETVDGLLHPFFDLHTVQTFRSSSRSPNFQNFPSRDPEITKIIRTCFIAREGRQLLEMDFSGIEVRIACVYTKDPRLIDDFTTPGKDPHRDTAAQLFCLPVEFLKANADWAKKTVRDWAKNRFVFPEFYGSVHFQCAPHIWESIIEKGTDGYKFNLPDGTSIKKHLARKGIKELGEVHPDVIKEQGGTRAGTYVHHVKKVEEDFWNNRFKGYTQWKKDWYAAYLKAGGFHTLSGFKVEGVMKRNEVLNYPIQGFAFHCLLWTLIQLDKWLRKNKMKSLIVGQIHDSMVLDAVPKEVPIILEKVKELVSQGLPRHWPCIIVPMEIEAELCPVGGSWYDKKKV
jgi:DNA polymerase-1